MGERKPNEAPEGSLRALGGDGRPWRVSGRAGKNALHLIHSSPAAAAEGLVNGDQRFLQGLHYLVTEQRVITPKQCDLILHSILALQAEYPEAVKETLQSSDVSSLVASASIGISIQVENLLRPGGREGGIDHYA